MEVIIFLTLLKVGVKSEARDVLFHILIKSFFIYNIVKLIYSLQYPLRAIKSETILSMWGGGYPHVLGKSHSSE